MAKKKQPTQPTLKKPVLSSADVLGFAEGKKGRAAAISEASSASRFPPSGDIRLTVNIRGDLHMRLKMEAVKGRVRGQSRQSSGISRRVPISRPG